jgi:hypothetical protein
MKFLNKKEQVIDLEMTPYGISMFAKGRFKPEYYDMEPVTYKLKLSDKVLSENYFDGWTLDETSPIKNTILNVIDDSIILEINENNTDFDWENFEIEVFAVNTAEYTNADGSTWSKEFLVPLYFKKQKSLVQGDILLEPDDVVFDGNTFIDSNYVEYYFDILVDKEIDQKKLCSLKPPDKTQGIFSAEVLECDELENEEKINIEELYDTVNENIDEDCE